MSTIFQIENAAQKATRELLESINKAAESRVNHWIFAYKKLWQNDNATPQEILEQLGTNAKLVFDLNNAETTDMINQLNTLGLTETALIIQNYLVQIPAYTVNPDGTVTIDPEPDLPPIVGPQPS